MEITEVPEAAGLTLPLVTAIDQSGSHSVNDPVLISSLDQRGLQRSGGNSLPENKVVGAEDTTASLGL